MAPPRYLTLSADRAATAAAILRRSSELLREIDDEAARVALEVADYLSAPGTIQVMTKPMPPGPPRP